MKKILYLIAALFAVSAISLIIFDKSKKESSEPEMEQFNNQVDMLQTSFETLVEARDKMIKERMSNVLDSVQVATAKKLENEFRQEIKKIITTQSVIKNCDSLINVNDSLIDEITTYNIIFNNLDFSDTSAAK